MVEYWLFYMDQLIAGKYLWESQREKRVCVSCVHAGGRHTEVHVESINFFGDVDSEFRLQGTSGVVPAAALWVLGGRPRLLCLGI